MDDLFLLILVIFKILICGRSHLVDLSHFQGVITYIKYERIWIEQFRHNTSAEMLFRFLQGKLKILAVDSILCG